MVILKMSKKLSEKEQILELLTKTDLTSSKIHELTKIEKKHVYIYLNILRKHKKICKFDGKKPYTYFAVKTIEYLEFLNEFFKKYIDYLMENSEIDKFIQKNEVILNKIEKVVNSAKSG